MWDNGAFQFSDAMVYYSLIRREKPARIVEVGSGWSTLVALLALKRNGKGEIVCIEPYPSETLLSVKKEIKIIEERVQDLDADFFDNLLNDGDIFFIDSTHTVKHNSDCVHLYCRMLNNIKSDVLVHVHDIRLPNPLGMEMMRDSQIYWTEQYLLYAYLIGNPRCQTLFGSVYASEVDPKRLDALMHGKYPSGGASLWFHQRAS